MTPWTVAHQAPLSMGFSRQEYWSELPFPALEDPSHPVIRPRSPARQVGSLLSEPPVKPIVYLNIANLSSFWKWKSLSHVWLCNPMDCSLPGFSDHGDFPGKDTGVGSHSFSQQKDQILYYLSHQSTKNKNAMYLGAVFAGWERAWWKKEDPFDLLIYVLLMSVHMFYCLCNQVYL